MRLIKALLATVIAGICSSTELKTQARCSNHGCFHEVCGYVSLTKGIRCPPTNTPIGNCLWKTQCTEVNGACIVKNRPEVVNCFAKNRIPPQAVAQFGY